MWDYGVKALDWLKIKKNRELITFFGAGFVALVVAAWNMYTHFYPNSEAKKPDFEKIGEKHSPSHPSPPPHTTINNSGTAVAVVGQMSGGTINVTMGEDKKEDDRKHQELLAAIAREKGIPIGILREGMAKLTKRHIPDSDLINEFQKWVDNYIDVSIGLQDSRGFGADIAKIRKDAADLLRGDLERARSALAAASSRLREERTRRNREEAGLLKDQANIARLQFNHTEAITALTEATMLNPDDFQALIELGDIHWMILRTREPGLAAYDKAEALAKQKGLKREESVALSRKGGVLAVFDTAAALKAYQGSLAIRKTLADGDKANREYQRDLSISYSNIGNMLKTSDPTAALKTYQDGLTIRKTLAEGDKANREYQRGLSTSYDRIGDMLKASDPAAALKAYQDGLTIALAEGDKVNREYQRDLSLSYNKIGDMLKASDPAAALKTYQDSLTIRKTLADGDKANRQYQRDLSVSYNKIGVMLETSDPKAALKAYQADLEIAKAALKAYQADLEIAKALAEGDKANREYQRDLVVSYAKLAGLGHHPRENWGKAHEILVNLHAKGLLDPVDEWMLEVIRKNRDAARE